MTRLQDIQQKLKAPKNQYNKFGGFSYRSCEDILEAVKPLLGDALLHISDEIVLIGDRYYVKATATFQDGDFILTNTAYAREEETKKGMDASQVTGACSSYARKYALNGLFLIDDNKDADALPPSKEEAPKVRTAEEIIAEGRAAKDQKVWYNKLSDAEKKIASSNVDKIKAKQTADNKVSEQFNDVEDL